MTFFNKILNAEIKKVNNNEFSYYITLDFPFPFDDRDLYVKSTNFIDPTTGIYYANSSRIRARQLSKAFTNCFSFCLKRTVGTGIETA